METNLERVNAANEFDTRLIDTVRFEQAAGLLYTVAAVAVFWWRRSDTLIWRQNILLVIFNVVFVNVHLHLSSFYAFSRVLSTCSVLNVLAQVLMTSFVVGGLLRYLDYWRIFTVCEESSRYGKNWPRFLLSRQMVVLVVGVAAVQASASVLGALTRVFLSRTVAVCSPTLESSYEILGAGGFLVVATVFTRFHVDNLADAYSNTREVIFRIAAFLGLMNTLSVISRVDTIADWWLPTQLLLWYPIWLGAVADKSRERSIKCAVPTKTRAIRLSWQATEEPTSLFSWALGLFNGQRAVFPSLGDIAKAAASERRNYSAFLSLRNLRNGISHNACLDFPLIKAIVQYLHDGVFCDYEMIIRDAVFISGSTSTKRSGAALKERESALTKPTLSIKEPTQLILTPLASPKKKKSPESNTTEPTRSRKHSISLNRYTSPPMSPRESGVLKRRGGHRRKHSISLNRYDSTNGLDFEFVEMGEEEKDDFGAVVKHDYTETFEKLAGKCPVHTFAFLRPADNYGKRKLFDKKSTVTNMLTWQKEPIPRSLFHLSTEYCGGDAKLSRRLKHEARDLFKVILGYMGDRKAENPVALAQQITTRGSDEPFLRDPIFLQLIKQTSGNPSEKSELLGWKLMYMCLKTFKWREQELGVILVSHITDKANPKPDRFAGFTNRQDAALKCYLQWRITNDAGPSTEKPTIEEITSLTEERGIPMKLFVPNGTFEKVVIPSNAVTMIIQDLQLEMVERMRLKGYDVSTFEIRVECENKSKNFHERIWLSPKSTIFECIAHWAQKSEATSNMRFSLMFRKRCFFESDLCPAKDSFAYVRLLYDQAVEDMHAERYQLSLEVVARLIAIELMVEHAGGVIDKSFLKKANILKEFIPASYLQAWPLENWRLSILTYAKALSQEFDRPGNDNAKQARLLRLKYINLVSDQDLYGCAHFMGNLVQPDIQKFKGKRVFLCVGWRDIHVVDARWQPIASLPLESVKQVRIPKREDDAKHDDVVLFQATDMASGETHDFEFVTRNAAGVKDLLKKIATAKLSKKMKRVAMAKLRKQREKRRGFGAHTRSQTLQSDLVAEIVEKCVLPSKSGKKPKAAPKKHNSLTKPIKPRVKTPSPPSRSPDPSTPEPVKPVKKPQPLSLRRLKREKKLPVPIQEAKEENEVHVEISREPLGSASMKQKSPRNAGKRGKHRRSNSAGHMSKIEPGGGMGLMRQMSLSLRREKKKPQDPVSDVYAGL